MPSSNELGVPSPVIDDSPDVPRDFLALANAIKPMVVPTFGSTTARDAAFTTAAFKLCVVGSVLYMRRGSSWVSMLAAPDIDTQWLAPTSMASGWSSLTADPVRYRVSGGKLEWRGVAFNSTGVPGTGSVLNVPTNVLPANISGWDAYNYATPCVATPLGAATPNVMGFINLRSTGSVVCILNGTAAAGATKVSFYGQGWFL